MMWSVLALKAASQPVATAGIGQDGPMPDAPVAFDPFEPGFDAWPYGQYGRLRTEDPVHWSELLCGWVVTRFDDVTRILRDRTMSSDLNEAKPSAVVDLLRERSRLHVGATTIVLLDDPEHARVRRLVQAPFTVRAVERLRATIVERVDAAVTEVAGRGSMELIGDLAYPLPVAVFCEMLGIPVEAGPQFREWTAAVARSLDLVISEDVYDECMVLIAEMEAKAEIDALVNGAGFADRHAERLFRRHLTSYFAAAVMMPYGRFLRACEASGYDPLLLQRRFGAPGDFAQAYVIAHEVGHHLQNLLGTERRVRAAQRRDPAQENQLSVRMELQADCYAGVWAHSTQQRNLLERGDVDEGLAAASAVGDDRIQRQAGRGVNPESWTHGSARQRAAWFRKGFTTGDVNQCDTFSLPDP